MVEGRANVGGSQGGGRRREGGRAGRREEAAIEVLASDCLVVYESVSGGRDRARDGWREGRIEEGGHLAVSLFIHPSLPPSLHPSLTGPPTCLEGWVGRVCFMICGNSS